MGVFLYKTLREFCSVPLYVYMYICVRVRVYIQYTCIQCTHASMRDLMWGPPAGPHRNGSRGDSKIWLETSYVQKIRPHLIILTLSATAHKISPSKMGVQSDLVHTGPVTINGEGWSNWVDHQLDPNMMQTI